MAILGWQEKELEGLLFILKWPLHLKFWFCADFTHKWKIWKFLYVRCRWSPRSFEIFTCFSFLVFTFVCHWTKLIGNRFAVAGIWLLATFWTTIIYFPVGWLWWIFVIRVGIAMNWNMIFERKNLSLFYAVNN